MARDPHAGLVRIFKIALPLGALALIAAVFMSQRDGAGRFGFSDIGFDMSGGLRLADPRFVGRTADGLPFRVMSEWALPDGPDPERVGLGPLRGDLTLEDGRVITLRADGGEALPKADRLRLEGDVRLDAAGLYNLTVTAADLDLRGQTLHAEGPVRGEGPDALIEAGSMRAAREGENNYIWFEDRVRVVIDPARNGGRTE
jgi:lipopolysaccharide export system protein LptC